MTDDVNPQVTLEQIVAEALENQAEAITLEYQSGGLEVCFMSGQLGIGHIITDRDRVDGLIQLIVKQAKLGRRSRGKMQVNFHGKLQEIKVQEYETFGESALRLILRKQS